MTTVIVRMAFSHDDPRNVPFTLYIEPWGDDFTLLPGEECELVVNCEHDTPSFHTVVLENGMQVYLNNSNDWVVERNGVTIYCGHSRDKSVRSH